MLSLIAAAACTHAHHARSVGTAPAAVPTLASCASCDPRALAPEVTHAIEQRIADLNARGAECSNLSAVLESSYRGRRITIRPFMWRVGTHLVSGEATANGDMLLAREIDSLNVGVRTVDDMLWTMEHEAAHIAFNISSGDEMNEARVNAFVRECKAGTGTRSESVRGTR
jgi:hypothetical protein